MMILKEKIFQIADFLIDHDPEPNSIGAMAGDASTILFLLHFAQHYDNEKAFDKAISILEYYFDNTKVETSKFTFCSGVAGLGWLTEYVEQKGWLDFDTNEILSGVDQVLHRAMMRDINNHLYDFLHGSVGMAFYYLSRLKKDPSVKRYLEDFVKALDRIAIKDADGTIRWRNFELKEGKVVDNQTNLGLSHGMPAILSLLIKLFKAGVAQDECYLLIRGSTKYIINNQLDIQKRGSYFPYVVGDETIDIPSRLAWCYGDLGVACVLWQASDVLNDNYTRELMENVGTFAAKKRLQSETGVVDAGLCHGSAGIAHIFNRFHDFTGNEVFKEAAEFWTDYTLKLATFEDGYAGYKVYASPEYGGWQSKVNMLEGISGIGLSLLHADGYADKSWDEVLMIT